MVYWVINKLLSRVVSSSHKLYNINWTMNYDVHVRVLSTNAYVSMCRVVSIRLWHKHSLRKMEFAKRKQKNEHDEVIFVVWTWTKLFLELIFKVIVTLNGRFSSLVEHEFVLKYSLEKKRVIPDLEICWNDCSKTYVCNYDVVERKIERIIIIYFHCQDIYLAPQSQLSFCDYRKNNKNRNNNSCGNTKEKMIDIMDKKKVVEVVG